MCRAGAAAPAQHQNAGTAKAKGSPRTASMRAAPDQLGPLREAGGKEGSRRRGGRARRGGGGMADSMGSKIKKTGKPPPESHGRRDVEPGHAAHQSGTKAGREQQKAKATGTMGRCSRETGQGRGARTRTGHCHKTASTMSEQGGQAAGGGDASENTRSSNKAERSRGRKGSDSRRSKQSGLAGPHATGGNVRRRPSRNVPPERESPPRRSRSEHVKCGGQAQPGHPARARANEEEGWKPKPRCGARARGGPGRCDQRESTRDERAQLQAMHKQGEEAHSNGGAGNSGKRGSQRGGQDVAGQAGTRHAVNGGGPVMGRKSRTKGKRAKESAKRAAARATRDAEAHRGRAARSARCARSPAKDGSRRRRCDAEAANKTEPDECTTQKRSPQPKLKKKGPSAHR